MIHSRFENLDEKEAQGDYEEMTKNNGPLRHGPWGGIRPVLEPGWTNISDAISTAVGIGAARSGYYAVTAECGFKNYKAACLLGWCESGCLDSTAPPSTGVVASMRPRRNTSPTPTTTTTPTPTTTTSGVRAERAGLSA